jgi:hypothetical protein
LIFAIRQLAIDQVAQCVNEKFLKERMFQTALMLINNRIIKEPIFQTVSKNGLRLSEKQKARAYRIHPKSGLEVCAGYGLLDSPHVFSGIYTLAWLVFYFNYLF